jgi:hypothetical protein
MKTLVTVVWSVTIEADLPDVSIAELSDDQQCALITEAWSQVQKQGGEITDLSV